MAHPDNSPRVGRSQGASIFWGLVSLFFAAAACFYFWKNHGNEINADKLRDEVLFLQDENDTLKSQTQKLQADQTQAQADLKSRSDFLDDKEAKLAAMAAHLENLGGPQAQNEAPSTPTVSAADKKFAQTIRKLGKDSNNDVVVHDGRPVLRVDNSVLFAAGDAVLKPDAKTLLNKVADAVDGVADSYELRIECFTDSDAEFQKPSGPPPKPSNVQKKDDPDKNVPPDLIPKPRYANSWELTAARAAAIARYFRDQTTLPFQNVLVIARGDSEPVATGPKETARNQRVEITLASAPPVIHAPPPVDPLAPPPEPPAPAKKDKSN